MPMIIVMVPPQQQRKGSRDYFPNTADADADTGEKEESCWSVEVAENASRSCPASSIAACRRLGEFFQSSCC